MKQFAGRCHCGNLSFAFEATKSLDDLGLRVCQCSFCQAHGARAVSDPHGEIQFWVRDATILSRYRMGLGITEFLVCGRCGVYVGALMDDGGKQLMTLNANTFVPCPPANHIAKPVEYEAESVEQRVSRRRERWTPTKLKIG